MLTCISRRKQSPPPSLRGASVRATWQSHRVRCAMQNEIATPRSSGARDDETAVILVCRTRNRFETKRGLGILPKILPKSLGAMEPEVCCSAFRRVGYPPPFPPEGGTSAPVSVFGQGGESPLQARALRPVTDCNCVAARRGGKQQEVNDQSVG